MSSTTQSGPPGPPQDPFSGLSDPQDSPDLVGPSDSPPSGPTAGDGGSEFVGLLRLVDGTGRDDGPERLVAAMGAAERVINHLNGVTVRLVHALHESYRDQILTEALDEDELEALAAAPTPTGGFDLARADLFEILDPDTTVQLLEYAQATATRMTTLEIAARLGYTRREASAMVRQRLSWSMHTPALVDALLTGELSLDKAGVIAGATNVLNDTFAENPAAEGTSQDGHADAAAGNAEQDAVAGVNVADRVAREVIAQAPGLSRRQVAALADTRVLQQDPAAAEKRHRREVRDRRLEINPGLECTATIKVVGAPADRAAAAYNRVDALARRAAAAGDPRSLDQVRGDLALELMSGTARFELADSDTRGEYNERGKPALAGSVGCACRPGGRCVCECGTAYGEPAELTRLEQSHQANDTARTTTRPAAASGQRPASDVLPAPAPGQTPARASAFPPLSGQASAPEAQVFPVVPVVPGEVPGRARGLPETILTVPLETVLGWINQGALTAGSTSASTVGASTGSTASTASTSASTGGARTARTASTASTGSTGSTGSAASAGGVERGTNAGTGVNRVPAWLEKVGPLIDSIAKRVLAARLTRAESEESGEFRIAVTDKQGRVVQYHALHSRTLRGLLREAVAADYGTCLFPTCATPAIRCQADHARDYAIVRATRIGNIEPLCGADHTVKTRRGYRVERTNPHDAGSPATWQLVMRSGHRYPLIVNGTRLPTGTTSTSSRSNGTATGSSASSSSSKAGDPGHAADDPPPF